jgi:hypothetical protein
MIYKTEVPDLKTANKILVCAGIAVTIALLAPILPGYTPPPSPCSGWCTYVPVSLYGSITYHFLGFGAAVGISTNHYVLYGRW